MLLSIYSKNLRRQRSVIVNLWRNLLRQGTPGRLIRSALVHILFGSFFGHFIMSAIKQLLGVSE